MSDAPQATRRRMLSFLGAAPLAAKAARDAVIAKATGLADFGSNWGAPIGLSGGSPAMGDSNSWKAKVLRFLASGKLPDWWEEDARSRNRQVGYLDPDIACKRSWSMAVKIITQRERNIERLRQEALEGPQRGLRQREFEERYGVWI